MKKTFKIEHPKIKVARLFESVKSDIRKYIKRERRRELPKGEDFWDFDCKFGATEAEAKECHLAEISGCIDEAEKEQLTSFYVEILVKAARRTKKPVVAAPAEGTEPPVDESALPAEETAIPEDVTGSPEEPETI